MGRGPITSGGQRLIGALATGQRHVAVGLDGLTRTGQTRDLYDQIDVDRPEDDNPAHAVMTSR